METMLNWYDEICPGDKVLSKPLWNFTERPKRHLPKVVRVKGVRHGQHSQTGVMFKVKLNGGEVVWLDADWFTPL